MKIPTNKEIVLILDNIRSVYNVGAIFRTADAAKISKIYLIGTTPTPLDRFNRVRKDLAKTALGAEKTVKWEHLETVSPLISKLKKGGFLIVAVEQSKNSIDYKKIKLPNKSAVILGNEVSGISQKILKKCDVVAEVSMKGEKESLNVSVTAGIVLFRLLNI